MAPDAVVKKEQIVAWIAELESKREELDGQVQKVEHERKEVERQLTLLRELLGDTSERGHSLQDSRSRFRDTLLAILRESSLPMHLVEIRNALAARGVEIPGQGADANIIAHLRRLNGVYRISRGTYSAGPVETVQSPPTHRRRRRRRRRRVQVLQQPT
jgi:hypothetical protein